MNHQLNREKEIAVNAVKTAAYLCRIVQNQITTNVIKKKDRSPVTIADFGSQAVICHSLKNEFPGDPVIAEETSAELKKAENESTLHKMVDHVQTFLPQADAESVCNWIDHGNANQYSDRFWTLDPIDGTKGFLRGEQYAISLALIIGGQVVVSALACPNLPFSSRQKNSAGVIFTAIQGEGTAAISLDSEDRINHIHVKETRHSQQARFTESVESGHSSHSDSARIAEILNISDEPVRIDSQAKYAVVARGEADIYLRLPTRTDYREKIWDHAGGWLIVTEAGGKVTDISGKPLDFTHGKRLENNRGVCVTNGYLHDSVLDAIGKIGI